jgi:beta-glucosidase
MTSTTSPGGLPRAEPAADLEFPPGFVWGAATSAYQVEGAVGEGGRGRSIWDTFSHTPGRTVGGETGDVAIDHYHRMPDDVRLMSALGLTAYRFSVAWPRVQPTGRGPANQAGLDFYRRLADELLAHGIEPWLTLYHWDLPQELEDAGGWPERDVAERFADYAGLVVDALGDRVRHWTTVNEPFCAALLGYAAGVHAPGRTEPGAALAAVHHLLLGHGLAVGALRAGGAQEVGITVNLYAVSPASDAPADVDAARRVDGLQNRIWLDPLLLGRYPADVVADLEPLGVLDAVPAEDLAVIAAPLDSLGVNYYTRHVVAAGGGATGHGAGASPWVGAGPVGMVSRGLPVTSTGWEIDGPGLGEVLRRVHREYPAPPLYVTENGAAFDDVRDADGRVRDADRIDFLRGHLAACHAAMTDGVPLRGYFAWSLADNFEWAEGYAKRFGLVYVDFATQERVPKDSAAWYAGVIRHGGPGVVHTLPS